MIRNLGDRPIEVEQALRQDVLRRMQAVRWVSAVSPTRPWPPTLPLRSSLAI